MVYKLVAEFKQDGELAYLLKKTGRPKNHINQNFIKKVIELRKQTDYGSEKIHFTLKKEGFSVSQHIIQSILDENNLTSPCVKRRRQRKYVRYQWPISNFLWHTDWSEYNEKYYLAFIDDRSRRIMAAGEFEEETQDNTLFLLYQAILINGVSPYRLLSDKGTQFYNSTKNKKGERPLSQFEKEVQDIEIQFWTSRRNHPQTNGKMEKWFDTMKKRMKLHPEETLQELVKWYNEKRIHHALGYKTPEEVYWENL